MNHFKNRISLLSTFLLLFILNISNTKAQNANSPLGVNLGGIESWTSEWVFVNIANQSYGWLPIDQAPEWDNFIPDDKLTSDLYLKQGESGTLAVVWDTSTLINGDFVLTYSGDYQVSINHTNSNITETLNQAGKLEFTANGTRFIFIDFKANSTSANISSIRLVKKVNENNTNTFSPDFIDDIEKFKVLRYMDFMKTNNSSVISIDDYTTENSLIQRPVSIEKLVELANTVNANPWFTIPIGADDNLVTTWAGYIANNLDQSLTAKVELSNEVWNPQFTQYTIAAQRARSLGLSNTGNDWEDGPVYFGYRSAQIHEIFDTEFANVSSSLDVCKLVSWQAANTWFFKDKVMPQYKTTSGNKVPDAVAIAPYFGGYLGAPENAGIVKSLTEAQLFEEIFHGTYIDDGVDGGAIDKSITWVNAYNTELQQWGISDLVCYEAGQHLVGVGSVANDQQLKDLFINANRSPRMKDAYLDYLIKLKDADCGVVSLFTSHGNYTQWGSWGLKEVIGQTNNTAPKFESAVEFINSYNATWSAGDCNYSSLSSNGVVAHFESDKQIACPGGTVQFTDLSDGNPGTWLWDFGDNTTSAEESPLHTYVDSGTYTVKLTASSGGSSTTVKTDFITVNTADNIISEHPQSITTSETRKAQFSVTAIGSNLTYQWKKDGEEITDATENIYTIASVVFSDAGDYTCTVFTDCGSQTSNVATLTVQENTSVKYEAEDATLTGVSVSTELSGFSGTGHTDRATFTESTDLISFTINATTAGNYPLYIAYRNDEGLKGQNVIVNGTETYTEFPQTSDWTEFSFGEVSLNAGNNTIALKPSWGWSSFDYILLEGFETPQGQWSLDITTENSTVTKNPDKALYADEEQVVLTVTPDAGYKFDGWTGDVTSTDNPLTISMTGNVAITANISEDSSESTEIKLEAEYADLEVVTVSTILSGYSGTGHTDRSFPGGSKISFTVNVEQAKAYLIKVRYLNDGNKNQIIKVNGTSLTIGDGPGEVAFPNSNSSWADLSLGEIDLNVGDNIIEISPSWSWTAFDYISIYGDGILAVSPDVINDYRLNIYPNPVTADGFTINITDADFNNNAWITITDINGKTLFEKQISSSTLKMDNNFDKGIYFVRIKYSDKQIVKKLLFE